MRISDWVQTCALPISFPVLRQLFESLRFMRGFADICAVEAKALGQQQGGAFEALAGDAPHFDAALLLVFGTGDSASAGFSCGGEGFACLGVSGLGLAEREIGRAHV